MDEVLSELHDDMAHAAATLTLLAKSKRDVRELYLNLEEA